VVRVPLEVSVPGVVARFEKGCAIVAELPGGKRRVLVPGGDDFVQVAVVRGAAVVYVERPDGGEELIVTPRLWIISPASSLEEALEEEGLEEGEEDENLF